VFNQSAKTWPKQASPPLTPVTFQDFPLEALRAAAQEEKRSEARRFLIVTIENRRCRSEKDAHTQSNTIADV